MDKVYVWDLDGTLLDSYRIIVPALLEAFREYGLDQEEEELHTEIIASSVSTYIRKVTAGTGITFEDVHDRFNANRRKRAHETVLMPHAEEVLSALSAKGARHFVYTHSVKAVTAVLERLGIAGFFEEVITNDYGFAHKPAPDALNYLIDKYDLDREGVCYVGDRTIDMQCARNAHIKGILYLPEGSYCIPDGSESRIVHDLSEIAGMIADDEL